MFFKLDGQLLLYAYSREIGYLYRSFPRSEYTFLINLIGDFLWYANLLAQYPFEVQVATNIGDNQCRSSDQFLMMELEKTWKQKTFTR